MNKQIVYNIWFKNEYGQWFKFRDGTGRFASRISDKDPEVAAKEIWDLFRIQREIYSPYYRLGTTVKVEPNETLTQRLGLRQRHKRIKQENQTRTLTQNWWVCPICGRRIGPDRYCDYCENQKEEKYEQ
jgi:rubrerythrin